MPDIGESEALEVARAAARYGQFTFVGHAMRRMEERQVRAHDVREAILTAKSVVWREDDGTWRLSGGHDIEGAELDVAVAIKGNTVRVITVF